MTRRLLKHRRGSVSVEFAIAGVVLLAVTTGLVGAGLLSWTRSGLQSAASATARCVALASPACASPSSYAATLAGQWIFPGVVTPANVTVTRDTSCNGAAGHYVRVAISGTHWLATLFAPGQAAITVDTTACHLSTP